MPLEADIIERIRADFPDAETAIADLSASESTGRLARCIVFASKGSLKMMREYIHLAEIDFRDVIIAAEYNEYMHPTRDLCVSFLIATPDDFWISGIADLVHNRGFSLKTLNSRPALAGPFVYTSDRSEGIAVFSNGIHRIEIEKADRRWSVISDVGNLRKFGLDKLFDDYERFKVQLDFYLSRH
jgi:hypothetical protein